MRRFLDKFGMDYMFGSVMLTIIVLVLIMTELPTYANWSNEEKTVNECRTSLIANAKLRYPDFTKEGLQTGEGMQKGRKEITCKSLNDQKIAYSEVKSMTNTPAAMKFYVMKKLADDLVECNHMYIGDMPEAVPFDTETGAYCGICKRVSFDDAVNKALGSAMATNAEGEKSGMLSYLINAKNAKTGNYYSYDLYSFKKDTEAERTFSDYMTEVMSSRFAGQNTIKGLDDKVLKSRFSQFDMPIDTSKEYYVTYIVLKGDDVISRVISGNKLKMQESNAEAIRCGAASLGILILAGASGGSAIVPLVAYGGIAGVTMSCAGSYKRAILGEFMLSDAMNAKQQTFIRYPVLVEADKFGSIGCNQVFGMQRQSNAKAVS